MLASFEVEDDAVEFWELKVGDVFVNGEDPSSCVFLYTGKGIAKNLNRYLDTSFDGDHIVCRVKFLPVNPQA